MEEQQPARLSDILNYEPEQHITKEEMAWIRATFQNQQAINIIRKVMLPYAKDLPIEEMTNDLWFRGGADWASLPEGEIKSVIVARQETIKWIMNGLIQLKMMANVPEESPDEQERRRLKDSTK